MALRLALTNESLKQVDKDMTAIDSGAGMDLAIYREMYQLFSPPFKELVDVAEDDEKKAAAQATLDAAQLGWKKLAYVIAKGVIDHLCNNMEVQGIETQGDIEVKVEGVKGTQKAATFSQTPGNKGHVC